MDKIERVRAVLRGEPVDRVPAGFWFHFAPEYRGGEAMARRHLEYYRATDLDIMKVMNDTGFITKLPYHAEGLQAEERQVPP